MSEEIVIEQENGKLTGKDPETGETVPVAFESTNTDNSYVDSRDTDYIVYKDGSTIRVAGDDSEVSASTDLEVVLSDIESVASAGEVIRFKSGVYEATQEYKLIQDDLRWSGSGDGTILKLADNSDSDFIDVDSNLSGVEIDNLTFDLNGANNTGTVSTGQSLINLNTNGEGMEVHNCRFINGWGGGTNCLTTSLFRGAVYNNEVTFGSGSNVYIQAGSQCLYINNIFRGNEEIHIRGSDAAVVGNMFEHNNVALRMSGGGGDWAIVGNIIEDNDWGIYLDSDLAQYHTVNVEGNQFQGQSSTAISVTTGYNGTGEINFSDNTYKRNRFGTGGTGSQIKIDAGDEIYLSPLAMTNDPANDAAYGVSIGSGATDVNVDWDNPDDSKFATQAIDDAGSRTRYKGVVGGGPLGGVDLSVTSGQFEGDEAMSSGATANTGDTAYSSWRWDIANSVWTDESGNTV